MLEYYAWAPRPLCRSLFPVRELRQRLTVLFQQRVYYTATMRETLSWATSHEQQTVPCISQPKPLGRTSFICPSPKATTSCIRRPEAYMSGETAFLLNCVRHFLRPENSLTIPSRVD